MAVCTGASDTVIFYTRRLNRADDFLLLYGQWCALPTNLEEHSLRPSRCGHHVLGLYSSGNGDKLPSMIKTSHPFRLGVYLGLSVPLEFYVMLNTSIWCWKIKFVLVIIRQARNCPGTIFGSIKSVEESQLVSTPFKENTGSLLWILAPIALISSLLVPQFFIVNAVEDFLKNEVLAEIVSSFSTEVVFYAGLAIFLLVTDHVQKPFLQFSPKRWSLITGLRGYLTLAFFTMGFKIFAPLLAVYVTWPVLGLPALVSVLPFLFGCLAQYLFERLLDTKGSSCWPLVPIIFEVYRIYQLTRATSFMEKLMFAMRGASVTPTVMDRTGALVSMIMTFRVLGLVCLWSLLTFLLRLFPSRPVAENY